MSARKKGGFTLIELLVVIAIIAILAAILFPVFARAREAARKSTCQNNLKECAIAIQLYYNDYDATLPSSLVAKANANPGVVDPSTLTVDGDTAIKFMTGKGNLPPTSTDQLTTWPMLLYSHIKNKDIVFCPSDSTDHQTGAQVSYWWKFAADRAWCDPNIMARKEGDFGYNADQVILYEHRGWHFGDQSGFKSGVQMNVAYLDSHVKTISLVNAPPPASARADHPVPSDGYSGADPISFPYEPFYYNFDNENPYAQGTNPPADGTKLTPTAGNGNPPAAFWDPRRWSDRL